jgi:hypothetical protein
MTIFDDTLKKIQLVFPDVKVAYKDESLFMKIIGILLFFNPGFMKSFITTIGTTIYFPTRSDVEKAPLTNSTVLLHEMTHIYDSKKQNNILFSILYLMPQLLILLTIPLVIIFGWFGLFGLVFGLPLPAYWRMKSEIKAYTISLYVLFKYKQKALWSDVETSKKLFISEFTGPSYYFMWPFSSVTDHFNNAAKEMEAGGQPLYEKELYAIVDNILDN